MRKQLSLQSRILWMIQQPPLLRNSNVNFSNLVVSRTTRMVFENHSKILIQHYERSELRLHFEWTQVKNAKNAQFIEFLKT